MTSLLSILGIDCDCWQAQTIVKRGLRIETFDLVVRLLYFIYEIIFLSFSFTIKDSKKKLFVKTAARFE